jgi:hypothetical protein
MSIDFSKINDPDEHERLDFFLDDEQDEDEFGDFEPNFPSRDEWEPDYCMDFMDEP